MPPLQTQREGARRALGEFSDNAINAINAGNAESSERPNHSEDVVQQTEQNLKRPGPKPFTIEELLVNYEAPPVPKRKLVTTPKAQKVAAILYQRSKIYVNERGKTIIPTAQSVMDHFTPVGERSSKRLRTFQRWLHPETSAQIVASKSRSRATRSLPKTKDREIS
ncbi:hypothetical protein LZ554_003741 [Drepanopeziza brunnea f. sp. 'monogermtubi']|nr:hypothetical protein LZ554_003741 [Drepanopeziza brunnea f. sp. 'monogermtubi']